MIKATETLRHLINGALGIAGLRLTRNRNRIAELEAENARLRTKSEAGSEAPLTQGDLCLRQILTQFGITIVFDVGASFGQYAERLRRIGYSGRIVSFEPQSAVFSILHEKARGDINWEAVCLALGDLEISKNINISRNSWSSSFLPIVPQILEIEPMIESAGTESVSVKLLDEIYTDFASPTDKTFLKLDVQGYEPNVLAGASEFLCSCHVIQMELALVPSYRGQTLLPEMLELMRQSKFQLVYLEPGFWDLRSGFLLETDGIFVREEDLDRCFTHPPPPGDAHQR
jgi:FkbM family methyltransferase